MARSARSIFVAGLAAFAAACPTGNLGGDGGGAVGAVHGHIADAMGGVTVMARSRHFRTSVESDGAFRIEGLAPGPATIVAVDTFCNVAVATATIAAGATAEIGDLVLRSRSDTASSLVLLRGFGLEERVTAGGADLTGMIFNSDGTRAYAVSGGPPFFGIVGIDVSTGGIGGVTSVSPPLGGPINLELAGDSILLVWNYANISVDVFDLKATRQRPTTLSLFPGWERRWQSGPTLTFLSRNVGNYTARRFYLADVAAKGISGAAWDLAHGISMTSLLAVDLDANGDVVYVPLLGCESNPGCTAEERSDEAAGLAQVMRLRFSDGADSVVAKVPNVLPPSGYAISGVLAGGALYLLHHGLVTRVDLATGEVLDVLIAFGPTDPSAATLRVPREESYLLVGVGGSPLQLVELPSLTRHDLVFGASPPFPGPCCYSGTPVEFRSGDALRTSTAYGDVADYRALWLDFSPAGALQRFRSLRLGSAVGGPVPPMPRLLSRSDGLEVSTGHLSGASHDQLFTAPAGNGEVHFEQLSCIEADHTAMALSRDEHSIHYLMRDPVSGYVQLFRMELP